MNQSTQSSTSTNNAVKSTSLSSNNVGVSSMNSKRNVGGFGNTKTVKSCSSSMNAASFGNNKKVIGIRKVVAFKWELVKNLVHPQLTTIVLYKVTHRDNGSGNSDIQMLICDSPLLALKPMKKKL